MTDHSIRIITNVAEARETVLRRRPLEEVTLPPAVADRLRDLFGPNAGPAEAVNRIIHDVRARGDAALREWTERLDGAQIDRLEVSRAAIDAAFQAVASELPDALTTAAAEIRRFHERQVRQSWVHFDGETALGQRFIPLDRAGVYAPGGRAAYPSTVLMTVIPAKVAGVGEVVLATPPGRDGQVTPIVLVAAAVAGVDRVFRIGGAQAIAALAYGTASVPRVDKILGPGNIFVTLAKRAVFGAVAIDQLAGPTETMVVADESADPALVAADLLAQAEHDPLAAAIMLTDSERVATAVQAEVDRQLATLERRSIAADALAGQSAIVLVSSLEAAVDLANEYAPEHLGLLTADPWSLVGHVRHAGAVFLGEASPHAMGDYVAGPNHVMPTGGTARFSSPITVDDFVKITSVIALGAADVDRLGPAASVIARAEGMTAHARAVEMRLTPTDGGRPTNNERRRTNDNPGPGARASSPASPITSDRRPMAGPGQQ